MKFALGAYRAAMCENDVLGDGETKPCATTLAGAGLIDAIKALEQSRKMLRADTGSEVLDVELDA
jgi:hypothetical protein